MGDWLQGLICETFILFDRPFPFLKKKNHAVSMNRPHLPEVQVKKPVAASQSQYKALLVTHYLSKTTLGSL